jgi:hypothetical protein
MLFLRDADPLPALAIFLAVCAYGVWIFNREAPRVAEEL